MKALDERLESIESCLNTIINQSEPWPLLNSAPLPSSDMDKTDFDARLAAIETRLDTIVQILEKSQHPKEHSLLELAGGILIFLGLVALVVYGMVTLERYQKKWAENRSKLPN
ncbi:hypothetical protein B0I72DRAFT_147837 [Yarrowia lipolytica]|nr:hypothetical protein B0I72DRAFT_147837 [Yarrowia lipolytica]RDW48121.1 hypothetical protein B0I74DRAFT_144395 [Yarrowia lipolytica]RDW54911.1 hypothetical protein B0I75DRAFT_150128 [Yarrowia lipolytica]